MLSIEWHPVLVPIIKNRSRNWTARTAVMSWKDTSHQDPEQFKQQLKKEMKSQFCLTHSPKPYRTVCQITIVFSILSTTQLKTDKSIPKIRYKDLGRG